MALRDRKILPPLWLAYPEIEKYSIGWRMGCGEDYKDCFLNWFETLSEEEQKEYQTLFPEPITWSGWWEEDDTCDLLIHGDYYIPSWQQVHGIRYTKEYFIEKQTKEENSEFVLFWGHRPSKDGVLTKSCFSQWWKSDFWSVMENYCCMEQFMMAQKAELFGDENIREQIMRCENPSEIKALGRKVRGFEEAVWDKWKYAIVLNGNWYKFNQNPSLREFLFGTGERVLVEASPYDTVWGVGLSSHSPDIENPKAWRGQNLLGFALMQVRDELRRVWKHAALCDWSVVKE